MYLLYADETNSSSRAEFFIYGGTAVPAETCEQLADAIAKARKEAGYAPEDELKFATGRKDRPSHIGEDAHRSVKRAIVEAAARHGVKLFACLIHTDVATGSDRKLLFQMNTLLQNFSGFLKQEQSSGIVLIDQLDQKKRAEQNRLLSERFTRGTEYEEGYRKLSRVLGIHPASMGQSHFCSLVDVVIGSLRWAVNNFEKEDERQTRCKELLKQLRPLCVGPKGEVHRWSMCFNPSKAAATYCERYSRLASFMNLAGLVGVQGPLPKC